MDETYFCQFKNATMVFIMKIDDFLNKTISSINRIFSDDRLISKVGLIFGINFVLQLISLGINLIPSFSSIIPATYSESTRDLISTFLSSILPLVINILTFPVWIYIKGYQFRISDRIRRGGYGECLPEHDDIKKTMSIGGIYLTINYTLSIPFVILSLGPVFLGFSMISRTNGNDLPLVLAFLAGSLVTGLIFGMILLFVNVVLVPCLMYVYLKTGSIGEVFRFANVWSVVKSSWPYWLILILINIVFKIVSVVIPILSCCLFPVVEPLMQTLVMLFTSAIVGSIYYNLEVSGLELE